MIIKNMIRSFLRLIFRLFINPWLNLLPYRLVNKIKTAIYHNKLASFLRRGTFDVVPAWAVAEMHQLSEIDPDLLPTPKFLAKYHIHQYSMNDMPGLVYSACRKIIGDMNPNIVFVASPINCRNTDSAVLQHIIACKKRGLKSALITTGEDAFSWIENIPKDVPVVELGRLGQKINEAERLLVLVRLVLQTDAQTIHILNSTLGWQMLKVYNKALHTMDKVVFASLSGDNIDGKGQFDSPARFYLSATMAHLTAIICDTEYYRQELNRRYGTDLSTTHTVYSPIKTGDGAKYNSVNQGCILWSGQFNQQNRPDILMEIARAMPDLQFQVNDCSFPDERKRIKTKLSSLPNVTFSDFCENGNFLEDKRRYSLFLHTSAWGGISAVLLDATLAGLPIVAPSVGGVSEFINKETGYPVNEIELVKAYVKAIRLALDNTEERRKRWTKAIELIGVRHSPENFMKCLAAIEGYFGSQSAR